MRPKIEGSVIFSSSLTHFGCDEVKGIQGDSGVKNFDFLKDKHFEWPIKNCDSLLEYVSWSEQLSNLNRQFITS